jgi:hypothetical protein
MTLEAQLVIPKLRDGISSIQMYTGWHSLSLETGKRCGWY